jgi:hypothetical protein
MSLIAAMARLWHARLSLAPGLDVSIRRYPCSRLLAVAIAMLAIAPASVRGDETAKNRLMSEAPKGWASLQQFCSDYEGSFGVESNLKTTIPNAPPRPDRVDVHFVVKGEYARVVRIERDPSTGQLKKDVVRCINPDYAFALSRTDDKRSYQLSGLGLSSEDVRQEYLDAEAVYMHASWKYGKSFAEWLKEPGFTVEDVFETHRADKDCVCLKFSYNPPDPRKANGRMQNGSFYFDPKTYWSFQGFEFTMPSNGFSGVVEYGDPVDGFPVLRRVVERITYKGPEGSAERTTMCVFQIVSRCTTPAEQFTLTAFGMPEPKTTPKAGRSRSWMWMLGAALATGISAVMIRRRLRAVSVGT